MKVLFLHSRALVFKVSFSFSFQLPFNILDLNVQQPNLGVDIGAGVGADLVSVDVSEDVTEVDVDNFLGQDLVQVQVGSDRTPQHTEGGFFRF